MIGVGELNVTAETLGSNGVGYLRRVVEVNMFSQRCFTKIYLLCKIYFFKQGGIISETYEWCIRIP